MASEDVWILGITMTKFGKHPDKDTVDLASEAALGALADGGVTMKDMGVLAAGNLMAAGAGIGQQLQKQIGQTGIPVYNVANACATGATALRTAIMAVKAGEADYGLAVGVEKLAGAGLLAGGARKDDGGTWTPKDLLRHLCLWEEKVLEALAAWDAGERAPIDREIYERSIGAINADGVRARSRHTLARVLRDWDNVHGELIRAIRTMSEARWENPATPRGRKALGHRIGQLLVGRDPFEHAEAHVKSLEEFVSAIPESERSGASA